MFGGPCQQIEHDAPSIVFRMDFGHGKYIIHVPISLNPNFAHMIYLLVKSIAANAKLPGDWRVFFTVRRDTQEVPWQPRIKTAS
jgi:hypothetical protein